MENFYTFFALQGKLLYFFCPAGKIFILFLPRSENFYTFFASQRKFLPFLNYRFFSKISGNGKIKKSGKTVNGDNPGNFRLHFLHLFFFWFALFADNL
jgi:hypothetical protein